MANGEASVGFSHSQCGCDVDAPTLVSPLATLTPDRNGDQVKNTARNRAEGADLQNLEPPTRTPN